MPDSKRRQQGVGFRARPAAEGPLRL
jgi:ribosomal protein L34